VEREYPHRQRWESKSVTTEKQQWLETQLRREERRKGRRERSRRKMKIDRKRHEK